MTPEATEMLYALNRVDRLSEPEMSKTVKKLAAMMNSIADVYRETFRNDKLMFERIFLMNWCFKKRCELIAEYLDVPTHSIVGSPDVDEVMRFTAEMITAEILYKVYDTARIACGITMKEFCLSWKVMNDSGEMKNILFTSKINPDDLHPQVKEVYLEEQKRKESEDRIQQMMRDNFLANPEEEDIE